MMGLSAVTIVLATAFLANTNCFTLNPTQTTVSNRQRWRAITALSAKTSKNPKKKAPAGKSKGFGAAAANSKDPNRVPKDGSVACGCGSSFPYDSCCKRFHTGVEREPSAEEVLRARFTAYKYRLPEFLVESTLKFVPAATSAEEVMLAGSKRGEVKRAVKEEKEELLKFIDSYDFSDLQVLETSEVVQGDGADNGEVVDDEPEAPTATTVASQSIKFGCKLRARAGGAVQTAAPAADGSNSEASDFLASSVVDFQEVSEFRQLEESGRWVYDKGVVEYFGETLEEHFDTPERQEKLAAQKAKREEKKQEKAGGGEGLLSEAVLAKAAMPEAEVLKAVEAQANEDAKAELEEQAALADEAAAKETEELLAAEIAAAVAFNAAAKIEEDRLAAEVAAEAAAKAEEERLAAEAAAKAAAKAEEERLAAEAAAKAAAKAEEDLLAFKAAVKAEEERLAAEAAATAAAKAEDERLAAEEAAKDAADPYWRLRKKIFEM
mmetsp:Transcript_69869/g.131486  ORF Transcript_69869/g.131486 Transcript_69869/m.131486 type:complete len:494 (-) Transcript_69869:243-1724(-)